MWKDFDSEHEMIFVQMLLKVEAFPFQMHIIENVAICSFINYSIKIIWCIFDTSLYTFTKLITGYKPNYLSKIKDSVANKTKTFPQ